LPNEFSKKYLFEIRPVPKRSALIRGSAYTDEPATQRSERGSEGKTAPFEKPECYHNENCEEERPKPHMNEKQKNR
jgi:hypothetical protein